MPASRHRKRFARLRDSVNRDSRFSLRKTDTALRIKFAQYCRASAPLAYFLIEFVAVRPVFPSLYEACANWIFLNVKPFVVQRLVGAQQPIEAAGLPFPGRPKFLTNPTLQCSRKVSKLRFPIIYWCNDNMKMVRH